MMILWAFHSEPLRLAFWSRMRRFRSSRYDRGSLPRQPHGWRPFGISDWRHAPTG